MFLNHYLQIAITLDEKGFNRFPRLRIIKSLYLICAVCSYTDIILKQNKTCVIRDAMHIVENGITSMIAILAIGQDISGPDCIIVLFCRVRCGMSSNFVC